MQASEGKYYQWNAEQVHDLVLFLGNTGLRPDEAKNLQHRDITIVKDQESGERILEVDVRGKRGIGFCKSIPSVVRPYQRVPTRAQPQAVANRQSGGSIFGEGGAPRYLEPNDPVFPGNHVKLFNGIPERVKLKFDRDGKRRTAYSLRHAYICMRLMEGADTYQIAKNCRTSDEMIEKFCAAHIKTTLNAAVIDVMRSKMVREPSKGTTYANRARKPAAKPAVATTIAELAELAEVTKDLHL